MYKLYQFYRRVSRNINVSVQDTGELQYITGVFKDWMTFLKPPFVFVRNGFEKFELFDSKFPTRG